MRKVACLLLILMVAVSFASGVHAEAADDLFTYLSPRPGAKYVPPKSTLIFRAGGGLEGISWTSAVRVEGSRSGVHDGRWITADDGYTIIFKPHRGFALGEVVTVSMKVEDTEEYGIQRSTYSHRFTVTPRIAEYEPDYEEILAIDGFAPADIDIMNDSRFRYPRKQDQFVLPPDFPQIDITVCDDPGEGYIFTSYNPSRFDPAGNYIMILRNDGFPVFFRKMRRYVYDFKKQPNGMLSYLMGGTQHFFTMDNSYTVVDSFTSRNGYPLDLHEFQIMPNGHVLLIADDPQIVDMSKLVEGGDTAATVVGNVIQEIDQSKNLVFQWRTIDFFEITDANVDLTRRRIRYAHVNAIEPDHDGNIMISSRHQSEVTKIDRQTGGIIWRMGGKNNEFTLVNDTNWFSRQHDCRRLPNGNVTVFDNGNLNDPRESRAVEYLLDEENKVATMVWEYRNDPPYYSGAMGSAQRLPNGNTMIGWGSRSNPSATEVHMDGSIAFEMHYPARGVSYRVFRFPWDGVAAAPTIWADSTSQQLTLHFTKFGDDDVEKYYLYRGTFPEPTERVAVTKGHSITVHNFTAGETLYFRVTSMDRYMNESPFSNELAITPSFSDSLAVISAMLKITPSTLNASSEGRWITAHIEFPGDCGYRALDVDVSSIMLNDAILIDHHGNVEESNGKSNEKKLTVKFSREEVIAILPEGDSVPITVRGVVWDVAFEGIDHIRVIKPHDDDTVSGPRRSDPIRSISTWNFPNPFNPVTAIFFTLPRAMQVKLSVYDVQGRHVVTLADRAMAEGTHRISWDGRNATGAQVTSGIYFYKLATAGRVITKKMVLLR